MNSIIQCLRHTKKLRDLFFRDDVMESAKGSSAPTKGLLARGKDTHVKKVYLNNYGFRKSSRLLRDTVAFLAENDTQSLGTHYKCHVKHAKSEFTQSNIQT